MATDGVKIMDGDHAHGVYHTFMDLYDAGASSEQIQAAVEALNVGDDFDTEIFITAYALALWETGQLTDEIRQRVQQAIQRGAFAEYLTEEEEMPAEGRRRQKVLERFWQKITLPNPKPRKRKPPKPQRRLLFEEGDVLTFQLPDGSYRATILLLISQYRSQCDYNFAISTYTGIQKPTLSDITNGEALGGSYLPLNHTGRIGFQVVGIGHKHLRAITNLFERVGIVPVNPETRRISSMGGSVDFESFAAHFTDFYSCSGVKRTRLTHPESIFPVQHLLESKSGS